MKKIKGVFFDLGGTLRICEENPGHQEKAKARMAELAGRTDVKDFIDMVEARYAPYRDWALTENREAGDFELWHKWLWRCVAVGCGLWRCGLWAAWL